MGVEIENEKFCACAFLGKIFIFGGVHRNKRRVKIFDPETKKVTKGKNMRKYAIRSACAVYRDRIVVSGGFQSARSCASYDPIANKWGKFPSMRRERYDHGSVAVGQRLYMVGGFLHDSLEFYDPDAGCFIAVVFTKRPECLELLTCKVLSVGGKIFVLMNDSSELFCYDTLENEWEVFDGGCLTGNLRDFCCVKVAKT